MAAKTTIEVPHLGGIQAGYRLSGDCYDPAKPTCVLINSMCTTAALYDAQFVDPALAAALNLLAIEPLGHGATRCLAGVEHFTYWDSAVMALQVLDKLGIEAAFALGTSQGGWMVARMALLAPKRIRGLVLLGTSLDYESQKSRDQGAWDPEPLLAPFYDKWSTPTPGFVVDDVWCGMVASLGFGDGVTPETIAFWTAALKTIYVGDEGRSMLRIALACLLDRDGLLRRLRDVVCPVYWLQGTKDAPYGTTIPHEQIKLFTASPEATVTMVEGGGHYLNATNPAEANEALLRMVQKYC